MKRLSILSLLFFSLSIITSCQKPFLDPNDTLTFDANAETFIDSAGIRDGSIKTAITRFVIDLKDSLLWTKFKAIYPMLGGTPNTMKWNLVDPRDLDSSYRLTFEGTPIFSNTGVLFTTTSDYANTHLQDTKLEYDNTSISYYSLTQNEVDGYDIGCVDFASPYNEFAIYNSIDASDWFGYYNFGATPDNTRGLFTLSFTADNATRYDNSVITSSKNSPPAAVYTGFPILIGTVAGALSGGQRECGLAAIGGGLSDSEALTFYHIVQKFESSLGR